MRKYSILIFALMLFAAACSESTGTDTTSAEAATTVTEGEAHETGEEEAHDEEVAHDEEAPHDEEVAHDEEAPHDEEVAHDEEAPHDDAEADHDMGNMVADRTIEVTMTDFAFDVDPVEVAAGETIEFVVANAGVIEHDFMPTNAHGIEDHLAGGHSDHDDSMEGMEGMITVQPGETGTLLVMFGDDTSVYTEIVCLIEGHYEAGMKTSVSYTG